MEGTDLEQPELARLSVWITAALTAPSTLADDLTHYSVWMMLPVISARKYA